MNTPGTNESPAGRKHLLAKGQHPRNASLPARLFYLQQTKSGGKADRKNQKGARKIDPGQTLTWKRGQAFAVRAVGKWH